MGGRWGHGRRGAVVTYMQTNTHTHRTSHNILQVWRDISEGTIGDGKLMIDAIWDI